MNKIIQLSENTIPLHNYILDPLSTIIKLAIISKKPIGCKISIKNNIISIQEAGYFQGVVRFYFKDNKNDIHYILDSIEYACINFINAKSKKNNKLFKSAIVGLQNLTLTYKEHPIIVHCLNFYISIINNYLIIDKQSTNSTSENKNDNIINKLYSDNLLSQLHTRWDDSKISIIIDMIDYIVNKSNNQYDDTNYIESFMKIIDQETQTIIATYFIEK